MTNLLSITARPIIAAFAGFAALPAHNYVDGTCSYCNEEPHPYHAGTYEEYVAMWERDEYEGESGHYPQELEEWEYLGATCLG